MFSFDSLLGECTLLGGNGCNTRIHTVLLSVWIFLPIKNNRRYISSADSRSAISACFFKPQMTVGRRIASQIRTFEYTDVLLIGNIADQTDRYKWQGSQSHTQMTLEIDDAKRQVQKRRFGSRGCCKNFLL